MSRAMPVFPQFAFMACTWMALIHIHTYLYIYTHTHIYIYVHVGALYHIVRVLMKTYRPQQTYIQLNYFRLLYAGLSNDLKISKLALTLKQPPIQWVPGLKRPKPQADHSPTFNTDVKNERSHTSTLPLCLHDV